MSANLDLSQDAMLKTRQGPETNTASVHGRMKLQSLCRLSEAQHQIKPLPFKRSVIYTESLRFQSAPTW